MNPGLIFSTGHKISLGLIDALVKTSTPALIDAIVSFQSIFFLTEHRLKDALVSTTQKTKPKFLKAMKIALSQIEEKRYVARS